MGDALKVQVKDATREFFKIRSRFDRLQRVIIGEALLIASEPLVSNAQANAPVLREAKRRRQAGQLRGRIAPVLRKTRGGMQVAVGPVRLSKGDKQFPFWGRFQERGWRATGRRRRIGSQSRNRTAAHVSSRFVQGKHFLQRAGESTFHQVEQLFGQRVIEGFEQIQAAGQAAGLV